ncbi:PREDICTED: uncharacterized protein LOC105556561 [Vollenhovia emeryi]|uniref:uncharacterized protein LOC105556561 n=1 Tax=Vollenhovia emeryi TaxID=411798 RepID=UPI0005F50B49|nr:PREDICTED: uncharacterized protein LOC105556561 [Vollenhovia emeryi]
MACAVCKEQHSVAKCPQFLKSTAKERYSIIKNLRLCINCLRLGHNAKACPSSWTCRSCQSRHHTLLHFEQGLGLSPAATPVTADSSKREAESTVTSQTNQSVVAMTSMMDSSPVILLSTVKAEILDIHGNAFPVRVLLDSASQANFITESCLRRGEFDRTKHRMLVYGVNDQKAATTQGKTSFVIRVPNRAEVRLPVEATVLPRISSLFPTRGIEGRSWEHLDGLPLADPDYSGKKRDKYYLPRSVDVLLGAEVFVSILRDGCRKGGAGEPDAFNTIFGWVLMGAVSSHAPRSLHSFVTSLESIDDKVSRFWRLEEVPDYSSSSEDDRRCEEFFKQTTHRDRSGRFVVSYPFSKNPPCFVDSRQTAVNRFRSLERPFRADVAFKTDYCNFMQEYLDSGHMEVIDRPYPVDGPIYYLPHHGVVKLDSTTTKLRVVFDASSKCTNGVSLNQTLLSGPKLQQDLMAVLLRFCVGSVALTADVRQMFRQVWIEPRQRDYQRLVWRFSESKPITDYRLKTVTFGIAPSPYLAIRCLLRLAEEGKDTHPMASNALTSSLYVDDIVTSVQSVEEARDLRSQLQSLLRGGGFELRKWASSHPAVLAGLDPQACCDSFLSFEFREDQSLKILGLHWYTGSDSFGFRVNPLDRDCSKRTILSELARVFDPLGFLTPLTFTAKRLIQLLWISKIDWDTRPPPEICQRWERYRSELAVLASLRIPRSLSRNGVVSRELHGFCDASEQGYGGVVYMRIVAHDGVTIRLIASKAKVAPLKSITLPRLELCAAVLLSELITYVRRVLGNHLTLDGVYAWSDSMVTLSWIRSAPHKWKTFVRNRIARIQENIHISSWGHVRTHSNPADYCSRGLYPDELVKCTAWWHGPDWLVEFEPRPAPGFESDSLGKEEMVRTTLACFEPSNGFVDLLPRFSSLDKICRIAAYCLRFIEGLKAKPVPAVIAVDQLEAHSALLVLVKMLQSQCFSEDIDRLQNGQSVPRALRKLQPFLAPTGVLRVGGRIVHSTLPYEAKHPALLPNKHRLTELIIERTHRTHLHVGRRATQYLLAQHFWILGVHQAIKRILSKCYRCFRANPRFVQPPMSALPSERVNPVKPFSITGIDYAGPFFVTNRRARRVTPYKVYVCLFICFAVKAIHLEVAFSLSTDSFLSALRRFIARRGRCSLLFSDCGTNFVGAHRELVSHMQLASETEGIKWSFNPPSAPHFGGLWESGVKAMKTHLRRVVGAQILTVEEFSTLLMQIEAVLNSRPLCPLSSDPKDLTVLSPGHFLTMEPLVSLPGPELTTVPVGRLDRWQLV